MKQWSKLAAIALVVSTFAWSAGTAWADIDDSCTPAVWNDTMRSR